MNMLEELSTEIRSLVRNYYSRDFEFGHVEMDGNYLSIILIRKHGYNHVYDYSILSDLDGVLSDVLGNKITYKDLHTDESFGEQYDTITYEIESNSK